jgi:MFS family permease
MFSEGYRRYVLGALTLVYTLNFLDRGLVALLLQPIKEDLRLSDTQLGFLTGIAFGAFYAVLGVPIARLADRGNRVSITSIAIGLWGATVMVCLVVTNFVQLAFARIAAAVGEAGCMPPTYSLLGDYFPRPAERSGAMSVYMLAGPLSALVSFVVGGWLNELYGWRITFFVMGIPALLLAALVKMTVIEPRARASPTGILSQRAPPIVAVLTRLWRRHSTRNMCTGLVLLFTMGTGLSPWYAAFMMRTHGIGTEELGLWLGLIFGIGGVAGIALGGYASARWLEGRESAQMRLSAVMIAALVPCFALFLLLADKHQALLALIPLVVVFNVILGPTFALLQRLVAAEVRATTLAVVMLLANLIGMGFGPQIVGILSDMLKPVFGADSLRYGMLLTSFLALWAAWHFWKIGDTVAQDLCAPARSQPPGA